MTTVRALIVIVAACCSSLFAQLAPASAGGPTSALLSVPGEGRTASLYYTDPAYDRLADLLGAGNAGAVDQAQDWSSHETGTEVTVTWLIHDVTPWRIDRIYLAGDGAPMIATQTMTDEGASIWDSPVVFHQPTDGKALVALLDRLGVGLDGPAAGAEDRAEGDAVVPPSTRAEPEADAPASAEPGSVAGSSDAAAGTSVLDRARWGLGGLAVGALLAAAWARARARRDEDRDEDRDVDLATEPAEPGTARDWLAPVSRS